VLGELAWWVTLLITARELVVTVLRLWVLRYGVIPASRGGKIKAFTQAVAIGLYVLPLPVPSQPVRWTVMGIAVVLTLVTGIDYVVRALRLRASGRRAIALP
jgi:CDP-diacylglycerol--glycerol-3-phosphate 3-phosphatidyltransferase